MPTYDVRRHRPLRQFALAIACLLGVLGCEDDQAPGPLPASITIVSGDAQYTRKGTRLEEPVVVRVNLENGSAAAGVAVQFQVIEGGGTLSRTLATTGTDGRTSTRWTLGPNTGANRLRISVTENNLSPVTATATASEYYCVEEDPAFTQKFFATHNLMLLTRASSHTAGMAGLVNFTLNTQALEFTGQSFENYAEGTFTYVVRDLAFSTNGDLFISWNHLRDEVMKVAADGSVSHFATLESSFGAEIAMTPSGVLVGCDEMGPFYVTCRDTLFRFEDAIFSGNIATRDAANNDALACDPATGDVYFIYKQNRRLYRIPFDGSTAGTKVEVATLASVDESDGARGMVVANVGGTVYVYILVESATTKSIVRVPAAGGVPTTLYSFFDRGAGDAAGIQDDLAINRTFGYLFTVDTKNNVLLLYQIATDQLSELVSDGDEHSASNAGSGERVGIDVIAGP